MNRCLFKNPDGECTHDAKKTTDCQFQSPADCKVGLQGTEEDEAERADDEQEQAQSAT